MKALLLAALISLSLPAFAADPAVCPKAAEQLPELLATAMQQRMHEEGEVRVEYEVTAEGQLRPIKLDGDRQYRTPVRIALSSLDCKPGQAQRYVLNVRFAGKQAPAATALAVASTQSSAPASAPKH